MATQVGPKVDPPWWNFVRQVVIFALGVTLVIWSAVLHGANLILMIAGLVLIGLVPVENLLHRVSGE